MSDKNPTEGTGPDTPEPTDPTETTAPAEPTVPVEPPVPVEPTESAERAAEPTKPPATKTTEETAVNGSEPTVPATIEPVSVELVEPETTVPAATESFPYPDFPEQDNDELDTAPVVPRERAPRTLKSAAVVGARVITGGIGLAVAAVVIAGAALLPLPTITVPVPSAVVTPVPTAQQLVCPGSLLRLANDSGEDATSASPIGVPTVVSAVTDGVVQSTPFSTSEANTGGSSAAPRTLTTPADGSDSVPPLIAGVESQTVATGDFVGVAAAGCSAASGDAWLVGGSTVVGRTTLITLSNPTEVAATVNIQVFDETGKVSAPGMTGIVVAPDGQRVLSLAGFAPESTSPVVHVSSTGGQVVANLQQTVVRGLEPGGVDQVSAGSSPSTTTIIPGVVVSGLAGIERKAGGDGFEDIANVLRVYVPTDSDTTARVAVVPEDGKSTGKTFDLPIVAGEVTEFTLDELAQGSYTVTVETDIPAVAAVRVSTSGPVIPGQKTDFAWTPSAQVLSDTALVAVPGNVATALHLRNPTSKAITALVQPVTGGGGGKRVAVGANSSSVVTVTAGRSYRISGFESLYASVSARTIGGNAAYAVVPPGSASTPIRIYP